ncbi:MAG: hypothetical protein D6729_17300 [Deltaproteobacteria bacterium]|nr:MAG: hypothetical protein D6729_17300 [Deltaproteobacteria bacterium]
MLATLLVGTTGCLGAGMTLQRVPVLAAGETEFAVGVGATALGGADAEGGPSVTGVVPALELSIRQGLGAHLDLGGRLYTLPLAGRIDLKWQWHESLEWDASVAPGFTVGVPAVLTSGPLPGFLPAHRSPGLDPIVLHLPLLFGLWVEQHQIVLAAKGNLVLTQAAEGLQAYPLLGGAVGFEVNLLPHGRLTPELSVVCGPAQQACAGTLGVTFHGGFL